MTISAADQRHQIASNLAFLMELFGHSQARLSHLSGLSQSGISKILNRTASPRVETLLVLGHIYGVEPWDMIAPGLPDKYRRQLLEQQNKALA